MTSKSQFTYSVLLLPKKDRALLIAGKYLYIVQIGSTRFCFARVCIFPSRNVWAFVQRQARCQLQMLRIRKWVHRSFLGGQVKTALLWIYVEVEKKELEHHEDDKGPFHDFDALEILFWGIAWFDALAIYWPQKGNFLERG